MKLGSRVKQRRKELDLSIRALAEKVGVSHSAINSMESRDVASSKYSAELADALGVRIEWLINGEEPMLPGKETLKIEAFDTIPDDDINNFFIPSGSSSPKINKDYSHFSVPQIDLDQNSQLTEVDRIQYPVEALWGRYHNKNMSHIPHVRAIRARGTSMEPTIQDGDFILIDTSINDINLITENRIYALLLYDVLYIKKLFRTHKGGITLVSENKDFPDLELSHEELSSISIVGEAFYRSGRL